MPQRIATALLPTTIERRTRVFAWLSLASQVLIVATGGAVRLTASGLGCPTWPQCTPESLIPTAEQGIHGAIEFGNRMMTVLLVVIALVMFLLVVRMRSSRPDLFTLTLTLGLGIPAQGVIGGITVWTNLNPFVVGLHFLLSAGLVALATVLVYRVYNGPSGSDLAVPAWYRGATIATAVLTAITVVLGNLTTGSGPHAGDHGAARNGLSPAIMDHLHAWPAYALLAMTLFLVLAAFRLRTRGPLKFAMLLLGLELAQIGVGLYQARNGLPELAVGVHMVLAVLLVSAMTALVLSLRSPAAEPAGQEAQSARRAAADRSRPRGTAA